MRVKIMSDSKRIKEKVHSHVSGLAGAVHHITLLSLTKNYTLTLYDTHTPACKHKPKKGGKHLDLSLGFLHCTI